MPVTRTFSSPAGRCAVLMLAAIGACPRTGAALDIALVNDDGWSAPGLQTLRVALEGAGHRVTLAAPAGQQSGSSAAFDFRELRIRRESANEYSVQVCRDAGCSILEAAEPATSALIAVDIATRRAGGRKPDLLISGINPGANAGGASQLSGTVGAAIAAASHTLTGEVPAIAMSTELPAGCKGDADCALASYRRAADFVVRLVSRLEQRAMRRDAPGRLLPVGIALNVNHPATEPKGVRISGQGRGLVHDGRLSRLPIGCADCVEAAIGGSVAGGPLPIVADTEPERPDADTVELLAGYVTIVPMQADYTADGWQRLRTLIGREPLIAPVVSPSDPD